MDENLLSPSWKASKRFEFSETMDLNKESKETMQVNYCGALPEDSGDVSPVLIKHADDIDIDGMRFDFNQPVFDETDLETLKYGDFLTVDDKEMMKYHKELRSHSYCMEKKLLSPIVERKVSSPGYISLSTESQEKKEDVDTKKEKKKNFLGSFTSSNRESRCSSSSDERNSRTSSPNITKMIKDLLLSNASKENIFMAIDPVEIEQKISRENSSLYRTRSVSFKRSSSLKRFFSPLTTRWFSSSSSSRNRRLCSDSSENEDVKVVVQSEDNNFDKSYGLDEVTMSPRSKRIQKQKNMIMRRNSSPELVHFSAKLQHRGKEKPAGNMIENKNIKLPRKKRSLKSDAKTKIENRQCTPKLRPKNKNHMNRAESFEMDKSQIRKKCLVKSLSMTGSEPHKVALYHRRAQSSPRSIKKSCNIDASKIDAGRFTREKKYPEHISRKDAAVVPSATVTKWLHGCDTAKYDVKGGNNQHPTEGASQKSGNWVQSAKSKKSSFHKKKQNSKEADEEIEQLNTGPVDPVYSLLKCAADLPRSGVKSPCLTHAHGSGQHQPGYARYPSGGDSSGNTSKTSSPSSSASHSPKTRRKKLNARMKSFSLDTPEPPKQLLGIDETTKKKSSSFTNTCFGGRESPDEKVTAFSASALRKKFAFGKASSLEIEDKKQRSYSPSPKQSPKSQRKEKQSLYVALYNFKAKEKDDMDLRAGWRVSVTDSSKKDWWKGKSHGKMGYFPAAYVIPLQSEQRVFQVTQPLNLSDGNYSVKFHKDQIVFQIGEETEGMILVKAASNKQAMCPTAYLQEL